jgi:hypothetical protein
VGDGEKLGYDYWRDRWCPVEALCVTEKIFTVGRAPKDLEKEKSDSRLGAKPSCELRRNPADSCDLGLALPVQFGD